MCILVVFFFSSRRRHTRCALVTGVQTCALPIYVIVFQGAVCAVPEAIKRQLGEGGRLVAVVIDGGGIGRGTLLQRTGDNVSSRPLFDAATPLLPGFAREAGFVF